MIYGVCHVEMYGICSSTHEYQGQTFGVFRVGICGIYSPGILPGVCHVGICGIYSEIINRCMSYRNYNINNY